MFTYFDLVVDPWPAIADSEFVSFKFPISCLFVKYGKAMFWCRPKYYTAMLIVV